MNELEIWEKYISKMDIKFLLSKILEKDNFGFVKLIWEKKEENMGLITDIRIEKRIENRESCKDEIIRYAVNRIKKLISLREPNYELPADSFVEEAIKDILTYVYDKELL